MSPTGATLICHRSFAGRAALNVIRSRPEEELAQVLNVPHRGLVFVEALMDKDDSSETLIRGGHAFAISDFGPTGPQFAPGANIPLAKS